MQALQLVKVGAWSLLALAAACESPVSPHGGPALGSNALACLADAGCQAACTEDADCPVGMTCSAQGICVCAAGWSACPGGCVPESAAQCGMSCSVCPTPADGAATCTQGQCGVACSPGFHACGSICAADDDATQCGSSCLACPTDPNGTATCTQGVCGLACGGDFHLCGGACASDFSIQTCGQACAPCAPPANAVSVCAGGQCVFNCNPGFHECNGACADDTSAATCGQSCSPCAGAPNAAAFCDAGLCDVACVPGFSSCGGQCVPQLCTFNPVCIGHWCWENPLPTGIYFAASVAIGPNDVWVTGATGALVHWDGVAWTGQQLGEATLVAITASGPGQLWIAGTDGTAYWGDGTIWMSASLSNALYSVFATDPQHAWASAPGGLHAFDGTAWSLVSNWPTTNAIRALWGAASNDVWAAGDQGTLVHWDGTAWTAAPAMAGFNFQSLWGTSTNDVWAAGGGGVVHYDGQSWTGQAALAALSTQWSNVWTDAPGDVWLSSSYPSLLVQGDGGTWATVASGLQTTALTGTMGQDVWAFGSDGQTRHWDGAALEDLQTGPRDDINAFSVAGAERWAVGNNFSVERWAGSAWVAMTAPQTPPSIPSFPSVLVLAPDNVMVGYDGVYQWNGQSWSHPSTDVSPITEALSASSPDDVWGVRGYAGFPTFFPHFDGSNWGDVTGPQGNGSHLLGVYDRVPDDVWAVGDQATVYEWQGSGWITRNGGAPQNGGGPLVSSVLSGVWSAASDDTWAVGPVGIGQSSLLHWDGGQWGVTVSNAGGSIGSIWGRASDDIWAAGGGALLHWDGQAWTPVPSPGGLWLTTVRGTATDIWLTGQGGVVLHYQ